MSEQKTPHVFEAWAGVCEDMARGGIGKNRQADMGRGGKYQFRGIDDVFLALSASMVARKLGVGVAFCDPVVTPRDKGEGRFERHVVCSAAFTLYSLADGSSVGPFRFVGEAADSGDKATNKAQSIAYKYFAIETFAIPTRGVLEDEEPNEPFGPPRGAVAATDGIDVDRARAAKPALPGDFRAIVITKGRDAGKTIGDASDEGLDEFQEIVQRVVDNPNAKLSMEERARATNIIDAIKREKMSR